MGLWHTVVQSLNHVWLFVTPMVCSMPGFPVLHHLPEFSHSCPLSWSSHPTISSSVAPFSSCPQSFPASGSFPMSQLFGQSIGVSASVSVLPMNIKCWFSLGLTSLISLLSKGLLRVFFSPTVQKYRFFWHLLTDNHRATWTWTEFQKGKCLEDLGEGRAT